MTIVRKAIPPNKCDYLLRMHLESIQEISHYMKDGCQEEGLNNSTSVILTSMRMRDLLNDIITEFQSKKVEDYEEPVRDIGSL